MSGIADTFMVLLILSNIALLGLGLLNTHIRVVAFQGILLGMFAIVSQHANLTPRIAFIAAATLCVKGFIFPILLRRAIAEAGMVREVNPYVGYSSSVLAGLAVLAASLWFGGRLPFEAAIDLPLIVAASLTTMFTGLFLAISRRKALTQCIGYVVFENGIYIFGVSVVGEVPVLVELGLLLDAFVAVLVMGVAIYRINREFDDMDTDKLRALKG